MVCCWDFQPNSLALGVGDPFLLQDAFPRLSEEREQTDPSPADQMWLSGSHRNRTDSAASEGFVPL